MSDPEQAVLRVNQLRGLLTVLQAIKPNSGKQICAVGIGSDGLSVKWEDDSKTLQSSLFLGTQFFAEFSCPWVWRHFGVPYNILFDTLSVFHSSLSHSDLVIKFPGRNEELICEMTEDSSEATTICTYSQIDTREMGAVQDLAEYWEDPSSYFLISGSLLKEAIEDLEFAAGSGSMSVKLQRDPPAITLAAHGAGDLEIKLPVDDLQGYHCAEASVLHHYKYKHMRTTVAHLPQLRDASAQTVTKVTMDNNGLIRVTHMMSLQGGPRPLAAFQGMAAFTESQRARSANAGVVHFLTAPQEVLADD